LPRFLTELAAGYGKAGRADEGLKCLDEAATRVEATEERWAEAHMHRVRGELLVATGDLAAAEASFDRAISVARRQNAKLWELRAATSLARLWCERDKRREARDLLAPIYDWFTEGLDTPYLKEANALLSSLL
jgi:predicted ATPase